MERQLPANYAAYVMQKFPFLIATDVRHKGLPCEYDSKTKQLLQKWHAFQQTATEPQKEFVLVSH